MKIELVSIAISCLVCLATAQLQPAATTTTTPTTTPTSTTPTTTSITPPTSISISTSNQPSTTTVPATQQQQSTFINSDTQPSYLFSSDNIPAQTQTQTQPANTRQQKLLADPATTATVVVEPTNPSPSDVSLSAANISDEEADPMEQDLCISTTDSTSGYKVNHMWFEESCNQTCRCVFRDEPSNPSTDLIIQPTINMKSNLTSGQTEIRCGLPAHCLINLVPSNDCPQPRMIVPLIDNDNCVCPSVDCGPINAISTKPATSTTTTSTTTTTTTTAAPTIIKLLPNSGRLTTPAATTTISVTPPPPPPSTTTTASILISTSAPTITTTVQPPTTSPSPSPTTATPTSTTTTTTTTLPPSTTTTTTTQEPTTTTSTTTTTTPPPPPPTTTSTTTTTAQPSPTPTRILQPVTSRPTSSPVKPVQPATSTTTSTTTTTTTTTTEQPVVEIDPDYDGHSKAQTSTISTTTSSTTTNPPSVPFKSYDSSPCGKIVNDPIMSNDIDGRIPLPWTDYQINAYPIQKYAVHFLVAFSIMAIAFTILSYLYVKKTNRVKAPITTSHNQYYNQQSSAYDNPTFTKLVSYYASQPPQIILIGDEARNQNYNNDLLAAAKKKNLELDNHNINLNGRQHLI